MDPVVTNNEPAQELRTLSQQETVLVNFWLDAHTKLIQSCIPAFDPENPIPAELYDEQVALGRKVFQHLGLISQD